MPDPALVLDRLGGLDADLDVVEAAERFLASNYRRFPVLEGGELIGQVSRADILRALSKQWS